MDPHRRDSRGGRGGTRGTYGTCGAPKNRYLGGVVFPGYLALRGRTGFRRCVCVMTVVTSIASTHPSPSPSPPYLDLLPPFIHSPPPLSCSMSPPLPPPHLLTHLLTHSLTYSLTHSRYRHSSILRRGARQEHPQSGNHCDRDWHCLRYHRQRPASRCHHGHVR